MPTRPRVSPRSFTRNVHKHPVVIFIDYITSKMNPFNRLVCFKSWFCLRKVTAATECPSRSEGRGSAAETSARVSCCWCGSWWGAGRRKRRDGSSCWCQSRCELPDNSPGRVVPRRQTLTMSASPTYRKSPAEMAAIHCLVARSVATDRAMYRPTNEVMALPTFRSNALRTDTPLWSKMAKSPGGTQGWR